MLISELDYVNKRTANLLKKLKIETVDDLLQHYPRRYEEHPAPIWIANMVPGRQCSILCRVTDKIYEGRNGLITLYVSDKSGRTCCKWFHTPYIRSMLEYGSAYVFSGKVDEYNGKRYLLQPTFMKAEEYWKIMNSLTPIYPLTKGLTNRTLFSIMINVLSDAGKLEETLPSEVITKNSLISRNDAIKCIHYPANYEIYELARKRIVFEEFYHLIYSIQKASLNRGLNYYRIHESKIADAIVSKLPYKMTGSQETVLSDIKADFSKELISSRLVQGDVGSGKTLIALLAMIIMADNKFQAALMAPTEVLATQHYKELSKLLYSVGMEDEFMPTLLVGSMDENSKSKVRELIETGQSKLIIGTHAIIQDKVQFKDLALAIVDEQHRFGVDQRKALSDKGIRPVHTILMTATPIPQTTGHILFGGMDISIMKDKPAGRMPIENYATTEHSRTRIYNFIRSELNAGHQAYVICPMVADDESGKKSVEESFYKYSDALRGVSIGILHGKMNAKEKNEIMEKFSNNEIQVLISTTVVEVGVNVPNATVIVIEGANNFGMLQLHQLRGRVGRGSSKSFCIFVDTAEEPSEKIRVLASTNDGFEIAEADYRMRKAGDLLGTRQSGDMGFHLADTIKDEAIAKAAFDAVENQLRNI